MPALARHYRVIRRDARGHGRSSTPPASYDNSLTAILSEIVDTLDQLGLRKVHFFGESTGGMFADAMAAMHPDRLLSVTTCSTPMVLPIGAQQAIAYGHSSWPEACRTMGSRAYAEEAARTMGTDQLPDQAYLKWWIDQVAQTNQCSMYTVALLNCKRMSLYSGLAEKISPAAWLQVIVLH